MLTPTTKTRVILLGAALIVAAGFRSTPSGTRMLQPTATGAVMTARGTFDVGVTPQPADDAGGPFSRVFLDKQYQGDLGGTSKGQLLGAETAVQGSAGYVVLEQVTGT